MKHGAFCSGKHHLFLPRLKANLSLPPEGNTIFQDFSLFKIVHMKGNYCFASKDMLVYEELKYIPSLFCPSFNFFQFWAFFFFLVFRWGISFWGDRNSLR